MIERGDGIWQILQTMTNMSDNVAETGTLVTTIEGGTVIERLTAEHAMNRTMRIGFTKEDDDPTVREIKNAGGGGQTES